MLSLRPVCGQDEPFLRDLIVSHIAAEPGFSILPEPVRTEISVLQHKARRGSIAATYPDAAEQIIIVDGQSAGWLVVAKLAAEVRLVEILISDAYRSRGVGSSVIRGVIESAAALGRPLRLTVSRTNLRAIRLYERLGFAPSGGDEIRLAMQTLEPAA